MQVRKYTTRSIIDLLLKRINTTQLEESLELRIPIVKAYSDDGTLLGGVYLYVAKPGNSDRIRLWIELKTPDMYYGVKIRLRDFQYLEPILALVSDRSILRKIYDIIAEVENQGLLRRRRRVEENEEEPEPEEQEQKEEDGGEQEEEKEETRLGGLVKKRKEHGRSMR